MRLAPLLTDVNFTMWQKTYEDEKLLPHILLLTFMFVVGNPLTNEHANILVLSRKLLGPLLSILLPPFPRLRLRFTSPWLSNIQTLLTRLAPVTLLSAHRECANLFLFPSMFRLRGVEMEVGKVRVYAYAVLALREGNAWRQIE